MGECEIDFTEIANCSQFSCVVFIFLYLTHQTKIVYWSELLQESIMRVFASERSFDTENTLRLALYSSASIKMIFREFLLWWSVIWSHMASYFSHVLRLWQTLDWFFIGVFVLWWAALFSAVVCGINLHSVIFHYVTYRPSRPVLSYPKNTVDSDKRPLWDTVWTSNRYLLGTISVLLHVKLLQFIQNQKQTHTDLQQTTVL